MSPRWSPAAELIAMHTEHASGERRDLDLHRVQSEVQVLAQPAVADHGAQIGPRPVRYLKRLTVTGLLEGL